MATLTSLIRKAQSVIAEYLPPDSGISEQDCLRDLIEILDGQEMIAAMADAETATV